MKKKTKKDYRIPFLVYNDGSVEFLTWDELLKRGKQTKKKKFAKKKLVVKKKKLVKK